MNGRGLHETTDFIRTSRVEANTSFQYCVVMHEAVLLQCYRLRVHV